MSSDAYHYTLPEPSGDGAYRAMLNCIKDAELTALKKYNLQKIDFIFFFEKASPASSRGRDANQGPWSGGLMRKRNEPG